MAAARHAGCLIICLALAPVQYKDPQVIEQYLDQLETPVGAYEGPSQAVGNNSTQQPSAQQQEQQSYKQATYASPSITPTTQYSQSPSPQPMQQPQQAGMSSFSFGVGVGGGGCSGAVLDQGTATPNTPACMAVPMSVGSDDAMDMGGTTGASHGQNTQGENSIFNRSVQRQPAFDGVTPSDVSLSPSTASPGPSNHGGVLRMAALPFMTPTSTPSTSAEGKGQHGYGSQQQQAQQQSGWQHAYGYEGAGQASDSYYGDEMTPSGTGTRVGGALRLGSMAPDSMDAAAQLPGMAMHESGASQPGEGMTPAGSAGAGGQPPGASASLKSGQCLRRDHTTWLSNARKAGIEYRTHESYS